MREGRTTWRQIAEDLRVAIRRGEYAAESKLPSRAQLMERYGVASQTVLNAMTALRNEGLVTSRAGAGVYVRDRPPVLRVARNRLARSERQAGRGYFLTDAELGGWTPRSDVVVRVEPASEDVAAILAIEPGTPVLVRDRVMFADDAPLQLAISYLPRTLTEGTPLEQENPGPGGIHARLEEAGHVLTHFREAVTISPADEDEARRLAVSPGTTLWRIERIAFTADGPIEVNRIASCCDRVELIYEIAAT